jgi:hypothetical protein
VVRELPRFVLGVMAVGLSAVAIVLAELFEGSDELVGGSIHLSLFTFSIFLFVLRDIAIVLVFSAISPKFGERRAFVFLLIVYTALPALLSMLSLDPLLALFWPIGGGGFWDSVLPGAIQSVVVVASLLVIHRYSPFAQGVD